MKRIIVLLPLVVPIPAFAQDDRKQVLDVLQKTFDCLA